MKALRLNEKGYTLLLTVFVLLLFSIFAVSLLSATYAGTLRNLASEGNVQAQELSVKGADYVSNKIFQELENLLVEEAGRVERVDFESRFESLIINQYLNQAFTIPGETGSTTVRVVGYKTDPPTIIVQSEGIVDGKVRTTQQEVVFSTTNEIDVLRYVVSTHKSCDNCQGGEGNLYLNGGVSIVGDLYVENNLVTHDQSFADIGRMTNIILNRSNIDLNRISKRWIPSVKPSLSSVNRAPEIVIGGDLFTFQESVNYYDHIKKDDFNSWPYLKVTDNVQAAFDVKGDTPIINDRVIERDPITITDYKNQFFFNSYNYDARLISTKQFSFFDIIGIIFKEILSLLFGWDLGESFKIDEGSVPNAEKVLLGHRTCFLFSCDEGYNGNYLLEGNYQFSRMATEGSLTIRSGSVTFEKGAYIENNLIIGNTSDSLNVNNYSDVKVDGPIYVDGDVVIKGADAEFNSILYVNGDVTIENSRIRGLQKEGREGSLIVFATGDINISYMNEYMEPPNPISEMKAFFYSNQTIEVFGTGSNIKIHGGLSANKIIMNSIRGRAGTNPNKFPKTPPATAIYRVEINIKDEYKFLLWPTRYFESPIIQQTLDPSQARLQIIYDEDILDTYSNLKSMEPVITGIDRPKIINRE